MQINRRHWLAATAGISAGLSLRPASALEYIPPVSFVLIGDTHYLANKESPGELHPDSAAVTSQLIKTLNELPGREIAAEAGGGRVAKDLHLIHAGDLIDTGDKSGGVHEKMQQTEFDAFQKDFGVNGRDGKLNFPCYEVHGNHDGPRGTGLAIDGIKARNKERRGLANRSANGLHYSWDVGEPECRVHFINLGIVVGTSGDSANPRRYNPQDSLDFLRGDLEQLKDKSQPIVITHHIDVQRYSTPCDTDPKNAQKEWHPCDARAYHRALAGYNVVAVLYGHTHARNFLKWDGTQTSTTQGLNLYNVDNASHFRSDTQAFFYFEITRTRVLARELATKDRWQTSAWTPQEWVRQIG